MHRLSIVLLLTALAPGLKAENSALRTLQVSTVHHDLDVILDYDAEAPIGVARMALRNHVDEPVPWLRLRTCGHGTGGLGL